MSNQGNWQRNPYPSSPEYGHASGIQQAAPPASQGYGPPSSQQYPMVVHQGYPVAPPSHPGYPPQVVVVQQVVRGGRTRGTAVLLAFFLGGIGVHKFYLGRPFVGLIYVLFCWTLIPAFVSWIDILILLLTSEHEFERQYNQTN